MDKKQAYITINLDLNQPIEIGDFARHFAGLGTEFDNYIAKEHPEYSGHAQMFVKEVRHGSIEADLFASIQNLLGVMNNTLIISGFIELFKEKIGMLITGNFLTDTSKSKLNSVNDVIIALAKVKNGSLEFKQTEYIDGKPITETALKLTSQEAKQAIKTIEHQKDELDKETHVDYEKVLMVFERPSSTHKNIGASTGERVIIEEISSKSKALIYASDLAEDKIKSEILNSNDNIFKLGFICDVNVKTRSGRIVCYSITEIHNIIDLPDEDEQL